MPRKGGPGIAGADLLVINKVDLGPLVGSDTTRMAADAARVRDGKPTLLTSVRTAPVTDVLDWVRAQLPVTA